jgi:hypothetical protein
MLQVMGSTWRVVSGALALVAVGCGGAATSKGAHENALPNESGAPTDATPAPSNAERLPAGWEQPGWEQLPPAPLSGRVDAVVAAVGDTIIVAGGWSFLCPFDADCALPGTPPYADGAAYDLNTREWRKIADAPLGLHWMTTVVVGTDVYTLSQCSTEVIESSCPAGRALLRYRTEADQWDVLPGPSETGWYELTAITGGVVAYGAEGPDYRFFLVGEDRWVALPESPLGAVALTEYGGQLFAFDAPRAADDTTLRVAAYDPKTNRWDERSSFETRASQVGRASPLLYVPSESGGGARSVYDPDANVWRTLPEPPSETWAGIIGDDEASYEYAQAYWERRGQLGWVFDTRSGDWLEIEPRPNPRAIFDESSASGPYRSLIVFGGQSWTNGEGQPMVPGELVNEAWVWRPPVVTPTK